MPYVLHKTGLIKLNLIHLANERSIEVIPFVQCAELDVLEQVDRLGYIHDVFILYALVYFVHNLERKIGAHDDEDKREAAPRPCGARPCGKPLNLKLASEASFGFSMNK